MSKVQHVMLRSHPKFRIFCNKRLEYRRYTSSIDICCIDLCNFSFTFTANTRTYELVIDDGWRTLIYQERAWVDLDDLLVKIF